MVFPLHLENHSKSSLYIVRINASEDERGFLHDKNPVKWKWRDTDMEVGLLVVLFYFFGSASHFELIVPKG